MSIAHPFVAERLMGSVHRVDGMSVSVVLPGAASPAGTAFGERIAVGEIGEFVVIDVGGMGIFGRLLEVDMPPRLFNDDTPDTRHQSVLAVARIQLLATLGLDGRYQRGVVRHPRVGDHVYTASSDVLEAIVSGVSHASDGTADVMIGIGSLSVRGGVAVSISASRLFGRHLAILGATGAGKSWTMAHLMEEVARCGGRLLLIDATGEFHSLGELAMHVSLGLEADLPEATTKVCLPHREFSESDRNAFLRPSGGVQLPKMRAAIRSLRLAHVLGIEHSVVNEQGLIPKENRSRKPIVMAELDNVTTVNDPHAPFDLARLPEQIRHECVYDPDFNDGSKYGKYVMNEISYCNSLVSRVTDLLQTDVIAEVINPADDVPSLMDAIDS